MISYLFLGATLFKYTLLRIANLHQQKVRKRTVWLNSTMPNKSDAQFTFCRQNRDFGHINAPAVSL